MNIKSAGSSKALSVLLLLSIVIPASAQNLIENGDFSNGSFISGSWPEVQYTAPGFTSDYQAHHYQDLYAEASYAIGSNPRSANSNFLIISDYTGDGNMLIVNGASGEAAHSAVIWQTGAITVDANASYLFEAYLTNIIFHASWPTYQQWKDSQSILGFELYDNSLASWISLGTLDLTDPGVNPNIWNAFSFEWQNGANTNTQLRLINLQTAAYGNDFALDGLSFTLNTPTVPEPSSLILLAAGLLLLRRHRRYSILNKNHP